MTFHFPPIVPGNQGIAIVLIVPYPVEHGLFESLLYSVESRF